MYSLNFELNEYQKIKNEISIKITCCFTSKREHSPAGLAVQFMN